MSLKYKVSLFVSLLFVISGLASVAVNRLVIMPSFLALERQQAERNTSRAAEAINRDLDVLSTNVTAWAQWDESKLFMEGANEAFVERELSAEAVASAEVSYMGFYRSDGRQVIHRAPSAELPGSQGLGELQESRLPTDHPLLQHADVRGDARGLLATPSGPMLVASRPIVNSSGEGPAAGILVFGRLLDSETISRIADQYKLELSLGPATQAESLAQGGVPSPAWQPGDPQRAPTIHLTDTESLLLGQTTIADLQGAPILTLHVTTPRAITARGEEASRFALATLCAVALAVLGVLLVAVHIIVLNPIAKMTAHAVDLGKNDVMNKRLAFNRKDELGVLAAEFDRMTDHLVEARQRLIDQSFISGKAGMAAGILHNIGNAVTPIMVRLNTLSDRIKSAPGDDLERAVAELESGEGTSERRVDLARFVQLAGVELASLLREAHEHVGGAISQIEHVQQILNAQERYSRAGGVGESVEIEPIVRRVAEGLSPDLLRTATVSIDPSVRAIGTVLGNRVELQQVVGNVILNAAESIKSHCISGGRIRVRARREPGSEPPLVRLTFEDNGVGISPEHLAKMFHRGFSTKQRGTGLGLHWSANTVAALGGKLYADSAGVGLGATLHLLLPLAEGLSADSASATQGESA
jgi:signal transduction histidine kinase